MGSRLVQSARRADAHSLANDIEPRMNGGQPVRIEI